MSIANNRTRYSSKPIQRCQLLLSPTDRNKFLGNSVDNILSPLSEYGGILLHNTPSLSFASTVSYTPYEIAHTNYDINAFQKSSISELQIQGAKLTAETLEKADYTLAVFHFLRTFTKMNYAMNDVDAGMPPRILYFSAYGDHLFNNVPVVIRSFTMPFDINVDYVQTSYNTQVPIVSDLSITLQFMPTPSKLKKEFNLHDFATGNLIKRGYI